MQKPIMKVSFFVLLAHMLLQATASFPPAPKGDPLTSVQGLVERILGKEWVDKFLFEVIPDSNGYDVFEIDGVNATNIDKPVLRGNNGVALASALNYYLKYYCSCSISWGRNGTGDQLKLPTPLPLPDKLVRVVSPNKYRYYQNVCTVSYSMVWWDWSRWEREIDWMAMNGLNLILSFTGQEQVWQKFYTSLGLTDKEIKTYFSGSAFLAWQRMGNIHGWGGPLDDGWIAKQADLQKQIVKQIRGFGMINVLPGFAGHVPAALLRIYPNASYARSAEWGHFGTTYSEDYLLEPTDKLFVELGKKYYDTLIGEFGTDHIFNADTYNEMQPSSTDLSFLKESNEAIYNAMKSADSDAVFLMQGWLFRNGAGFWSAGRIKAYLSGVPNDRMIILDLSSEQDPIWSKTESFFGKPFIWCMLHNYGGIRGIYGNLTTIGMNPVDARRSPGSTMVGVGMTPEAIEHNPIMYDLMGEMSWRSEKIEGYMPWVEAYATRRYGGMTPGVRNAWILLLSGAYQFHWSGRIKSLTVQAPGFNLVPDLRFATAKIATAWKLIVTDVIDKMLDPSVGPLRYDIVDIGRQVLVNLFADVYKIYTSAYSVYTKTKDRNVYSAMRNLEMSWMEMFDDLDSLLASDTNFLLGHWLADARNSAASGASVDVVNQLEYNARNQITMWGPKQNIEDYAAKEWAGLISSYYATRWRLFLRLVNQYIVSNEPFNMNVYNELRFITERNWGEKIEAFPTKPIGDTIDVAKKILAKYFREDNYVSNNYTLQVDYDVPDNDLYGAEVSLWTNSTEQYIVLCELNPACVGFSCGTDLKMVSFKSSVSGVKSTSGRMLYLKKKM